MKDNEIILEYAPDIEGLRFRKYKGESDYPLMVAILEATSKADNEDRAIKLEDIKNDYEHLKNSDPYTDMLFAEIDGKTVAYSRVEWWQEEDPNHRIYSLFANIIPDVRNQGIETAMLRWCELRIKEIAESHPQDSKRFFQTYSSEFKPDLNQLLEERGYTPARFFIEMSRRLDEIPEAELAQGLEVRAVEEKDARKVIDASNEAFRDHWGFTQPTEENIQS